MQFPLVVTDDALSKLRHVFAAAPGKNLRVAVRGGGCSGFQYDFLLEDTVEDGDFVLPLDDRLLLVDPVSAPYLEGATLDYVAELAGARFVFVNPKAKATCGCGNSFSA